MDSQNKPLYDVANLLSTLIRKEQWEEGLHHSLAWHFREVHSAFDNMDKLLKKFGEHSHVLSRAMLDEILNTLSLDITRKTIPITSIRLTTARMGYGEFELSFRTVDDFVRFTNEFDEQTDPRVREKLPLTLEITI